MAGKDLGWLLGGWSAVLFVNAVPSNDPYTELGFTILIVIVLSAVGSFIGAVLVVWVALRVIHAPRAGVSALVCGLLLTVIAPLTAGLNATLVPLNIGAVGLHSALLVRALPSLLCALVTYTLVTSRAKARIISQAA